MQWNCIDGLGDYMNEAYQEVEVLWLAKNKYYSGSSLITHVHKEYHQIYFVIQGTGTFLVNGEPNILGEKMFVMACPNVYHGIELLQSDQDPALTILEAKFVVFGSELASNLLKLPLVCKGTPKMQEVLEEMFQEGIQKDEYYENTVTNLISYFLYLAIRLYRNFGFVASNQKLQPKPTTLIKEYIHRNYTEDVSLDTLAKLTGYSKNYLCRIFHENTGITINSYLNKVRIHYAAQMLSATDLDLAEISGRTGYNNVFHFIKTFKKIVGVPPGIYRKSELVGAELVTGQVTGLNSIIRTGEVLSILLDKN